MECHIKTLMQKQADWGFSMTNAKQDKIFVGNGRAITTDSGYSFLSFTLSPEDIAKINVHAVENNGWCKLNITQRKQPSAKGTTHFGTINTWKPTDKPSNIVENVNSQQPIMVDGQEIPF